MGEWKRVFLNRGRIGLILLLTVLCVALFVASLLDRIGSGELETAIVAGEYAQSLVERWRDKDSGEIADLAEAEIGRLNGFSFWYYPSPYQFFEPAFSSEEEAYASIEDIGYLVKAAESGGQWAVANVIDTFSHRAAEAAEVAEYAAGYDAYLQKVQAQAELQAKTAIFGAEGSFSRRNLAKTADDFRLLFGVEPVFGNNRGIEKWLSYDLGDYCHLLGMIMIVMAFLEERKNGLWSVVRTCRGGRLRLWVRRVGILLAASALFTLLFCGINLLISLSINGGFGELDRPLQSLESFKTCALLYSIWEWIYLYLLVKVLSGVVVGLIIWSMLGAVTNVQFSLSVVAGVLGVEYILFALLPVQSVFNVFKYLNIFSYVHTSALYTSYLNVDLFGYPVGNRHLALTSMAVLGALALIATTLIQAKRRPEGNRDLLSGLALRISGVLDAARTRLSIGGWEAYKLLVYQYGAVVLVLIFLATGSLNYAVNTPAETDAWYEAYLADLEGPIDASTDNYFVTAREKAASSSESAALLMSLARLEDRVAALRERASAGGYAPWLLNARSLIFYFGLQGADVQRLNATLGVIFTAFVCAGLASYERQSGVVGTLRSMKRGRGGLFWRKAILVCLVAAFVWGCIYVRELVDMVRRTGGEVFRANVRNIDALALFPLNVSVAGYAVILYTLRYAGLCAAGFAALYIGSLFPALRVSYVACVAVLGVPALLVVLGVDFLKWVSPVVPVAAAELMWSLGAGQLAAALPWLAWLAIGGFALFLYHRRAVS